MTQPQKNTALASAIVAGVISLPLTWMTIRPETMESPLNLNDILNSPFRVMTFNVTGFNGHVTFPFRTPIWFIVGIAIAANVLQLMQNSKMFAISRVAEWLTSIIAVAWVLVVIIVALLSDRASLGIGSVLGLASAVIPIVCLAIPESQTHTTDSSNSDPTNA